MNILILPFQLITTLMGFILEIFYRSCGLITNTIIYIYKLPSNIKHKINIWLNKKMDEIFI